ncbi:MAG: CoA ester lyase [Acidobacteria bacterium]|nr:CoA ester lyase [Acidobacteriota bacterium]MCI0722050.1 CoA ester lyase [Acidobacteriota bacterium]
MRSLLFVPGNDRKKLLKAAEIPADGLIFDWEDSVLPADKDVARSLTTSLMSENWQFQATVLVRFNRVDTKDFQEDCRALRNLRADGILLSKCQSAQETMVLAEVLDHQDAGGQMKILALIESAAGILNAPQIASSCSRMSSLVFGSEDYCADVGISRTPGDVELLFARSTVVTASKAFGLEAIDSPCLDWSDGTKLQGEAQAARNLGFTGKLAIHPAQVPILNELFSPTEAEIDNAQKVLAAFSANRSGVLTLDGRMVDEAVVRRARQVLRTGKVNL